MLRRSKCDRAHTLIKSYPARQLARSSTATKDKNKAYAATLRLPKTTFPLWSEPSQREEPYRKRTTGELYKWQSEHAKGPLFVLHDGPPYANGNLHMGHALNKVLKDIINRYQVLQGRRVSYVPGWDCHGLPIENKALQELKTDHQSLSPSTIRKAARATALREIDVQREEFMKFAVMADWSPEGTYRTLDHDYEIRQLKVFLDMVRKGLIYRNYRPVHWSPSSGSALAEAELKYHDDHKSRSAYVLFPVIMEELSKGLQLKISQNPALSSEPISLLIWTTTPWTLPANMAIAVNSRISYAFIRRTEHPEQGIMVVAKDLVESLQNVMGPLEVIGTVTGSDLLGTGYSHLFASATKPIHRVLSANYVTVETGTGLVHSAPAHGAEDYGTFRDAGLLHSQHLVCPVDNDGRFTEEILSLAKNPEHGQRLIGKEVLYGGTKEILSILHEAGVLVAEKKIKHKYPYDWKTGKPIIVRATSQWFANVDNIKQDAIQATSQVRFYPEQARSRLQSFVRERSEWCISRQRSWGVPIPALHDLETNEDILTEESLTHIISVLEEKGVEHWFTGPVSDFIPPSLLGSGRSFVKGADTVDVWFDSGTAWSLVRDSHGARVDKEGAKYFADVVVEGSDQHRGWFQSLLLTSISATKDSTGQPTSPYKSLLTHGFVLDQDGKKMSKSLGNVISPITIIEGGKDKKKEPAHGADVLRLWSATVEYGKDVALGPTVLAQAAESLRKIRNTIRFLLGNLEDGAATGANFQPVKREEMSLPERYVMHELHFLETRCKEAYESFNFSRVAVALHTFASHTMSSLYFDITKDTLYADSPESIQRRAVVTVLNEVLRVIVPIMAPILPHLAEETHAVLSERNGTQATDVMSVFSQGWQPVALEWHDMEVEKDMQSLLRSRDLVLELLEKARKDKHVRSSLEATVSVSLPSGSPSSLPRLLREQSGLLKTLYIVSDVSLHEGKVELPSDKWHYSGTIQDPDSKEDISFHVLPPHAEKCPRCWTWTKSSEDDLCSRCKTVAT